jgi:membrane protein DedA with SNARE-associated domain
MNPYVKHLVIGAVASTISIATSCMISHQDLAPIAMLAACKASVVGAFVSYWVGAVQKPPQA